MESWRENYVNDYHLRQVEFTGKNPHFFVCISLDYCYDVSWVTIIIYSHNDVLTFVLPSQLGVFAKRIGKKKRKNGLWSLLFYFDLSVGSFNYFWFWRKKWRPTFKKCIKKMRQYAKIFCSYATIYRLEPPVYSYLRNKFILEL